MEQVASGTQTSVHKARCYGTVKTRGREKHTSLTIVLRFLEIPKQFPKVISSHCC